MPRANRDKEAELQTPISQSEDSDRRIRHGAIATILLSFLAALIGGLYLLGVFRQRRPGEPPLDKGFIPWLGHVLEFRRNTSEFLERMQQKHGDVFTIQLGGFYITFLQDPLSFGAFVKESRDKLDFSKFAKQLVERVFGYTAIEEDHQILQASSSKHLKGDGLELMTQAMMVNLQNLMLNNIGSAADQSTWIEDGLFMYSYNILFRAGYLSLFGNIPNTSEGSEEKAKEKDRAESEVLFREFRKYDQLFPNLAYGVLPPKERLEAKRLTEHFAEVLSVQKMKAKDNISRWVWDIQHAKEEHGMSESMINKYMLVLLWASQGNTGPSSFWLLLFLMKHPEAMAAVKEEVDKVVKESGQEVRRGGPLVNLTYEMMKKTPVLDSAVEETLRLTAAPLLTRAVLQDMTLKMADGRKYFIRKDDRMAMFPYIAVHRDPEIHPDPHSFKYNRFLNPDGTKKTDFYKAGRKVKYYSMPWGAGVSMCPGRFFATNELKQFVFLMLVYFEFKLKNPDEEIPEIDFRRWGFGSMQPQKENCTRTFNELLVLVHCLTRGACYATSPQSDGEGSLEGEASGGWKAGVIETRHKPECEAFTAARTHLFTQHEMPSIVAICLHVAAPLPSVSSAGSGGEASWQEQQASPVHSDGRGDGTSHTTEHSTAVMRST
ncbi:hypothetical protein INR49_010619 [Caranx melampygus]|nr:hypothetical protein INR49_010619 [Caranx melampygus]